MTSFPSCPTLSAVREWYAQGGDPEQGLCALARRIRRDSANGVWITLIDENEIRERVRELKAACATLPEEERRARYPLLGIPFAVKDNMDVAGKETTAACPAYAYAATSTAFVVQRLLDAGAVRRALEAHRGSAGWRSCAEGISLVENAGFMGATLTGAL